MTTRARRLGQLGAILLAVGAALFWVLRDADGARGAPAVVRPPSAEALEPAAAPTPVEFAESNESAPLSAPTSAARDAAADDVLVLVVLHADGEPARGARVGVRVAPDDAWLVTGTLGDAGRFETRALATRAEIVVAGATPQPVHFELDPAHGEHTLRLPDGAVLAGQVLVDGAPPGAPIPVGFANAYGAHAKLRAGGFPEARRAGFLVRAGHGAQLTDAAGRFRFSGLRAGERVQLEGPRFFLRHDERSTSQPVEAPHENVLLDLARPASLFGRVVHADGTPAPDAVLTVSLLSKRSTEPEAGSPEWDLSSGQPMFDAASGDELGSCAAGPDGVFELPVGNLMSRARVAAQRDEDPPAVHGVTLHASCAHGSASRVLDEVDVTRDAQLADLVLVEPQRVTLRVVDPEGAPIASAFVTQEAPDFGSDRHAVDERGEVRIELAAQHYGPVTVAAQGFESVRVTPWGTTEEPLLVELRRAAGLRLVLRGPWDEPLHAESGWTFRSNIAADDTPFQDRLHPSLSATSTSTGPDGVRPKPAGVTLFSWVSDERGRRVHQWTFTHGDVPFDALRAHHPIHVALELLECPEHLERVSEAPFFELELWLEPGERRELEVDVTSAVRPR